MAQFDPKRVSTFDWAVIGAGVVAFIASFFNWYRVKVTAGPVSSSSGGGAWDVGFAAWFSVILLLVAAGLVLAHAMGTTMNLPVPLPVITLGLSALAFILILLRWLTFPDADGGLSGIGGVDDYKVSSGAGFGLYLGLLCALVAAVASFMTFRASGGDLRNLRQTPPAAPLQ